MGDKYINDVGLQTIKQWIVANFTNIIEQVKVNGTALTPDANKAVDISVAELEANESLDQVTITGDGEIQFTNSANGMTVKKTYPSDNYESVELASKSYVDSNGGKIDTIKVNGTAQTITNKEVDITVPTKVSDLTNDSNYQTASDVTSSINTALANSGDAYQTESDVSTAISQAVSSAYKYKGSVATINDLPSSGNVVGDVYDVQSNGMNYAWNGTSWDALGTYVDTSNFWTSESGQANTLLAMTVAEINAILNA